VCGTHHKPVREELIALPAAIKFSCISFTLALSVVYVSAKDAARAIITTQYICNYVERQVLGVRKNNIIEA
jgi:hypothetical protein